MPCSSKILTQDKDHFAELAVDAVMRLKGSGNLESIHVIKKVGGMLKVRLHNHHASIFTTGLHVLCCACRTYSLSHARETGGYQEWQPGVYAHRKEARQHA